MSTGTRLLFILLAVSAAAVAAAEVRVDVADAVPDTQGKVTVEIVIDSDGERIGGFQNDIIFDHTVVRLESVADCRINPAIGTTPLGVGEDIPTCADDRTLGPCKTLSRSLAVCSGEPLRDGCPAEAPDYSRFRAILAGTEVPNENAIPDGVAYTCTFTVVNPAVLPVRLFNSFVVVSDPFGERIAGAAIDGGVCVDEDGGRRCAPLREIEQGCVIDFECASGHCDRCCGHQFNGICAAPRTVTPTAVATPTRTLPASRTPSSTRTPAPTRTATSTPLPQPAGERCTATSQCAADLACNPTDGVCCTSESCPDGTSCRTAGLEGYCIGTVSRPPGGEATAEVSVWLRSGGKLVGGMQNDIILLDDIMRIDAADCAIESAIGLFPFGQEATSCFDDTSVGACKNLAKVVQECGFSPPGDGCPPGAGAGVSVFRGIVVATAVPNSNGIPDGRLYTCRATVLDATRVTETCTLSNVVVSDPFGTRLDGVGIDCRVELTSVVPGPDGATCSDSNDCESANCVDGVCCGDTSCALGESCAITGEAGHCAARRAAGAGCNLGADCISGNCDLLLGSPISEFRGACGEVRAGEDHPGECVTGGDCDTGNCVGGFCCDVDSCPAGRFCNSGRCDLPAEPGSRCTADEQCALGLCVDGACCVTGVCPEGQSCGILALEGLCREPLRSGSACTLDEQCPSGFCTDGVCCRVDQCPQGFYCAPLDPPGECAEIVAEPGTDGESATPTPMASGSACEPGDCASGFCVDGVCCAEESCQGANRCNILGFEGACAPPLTEGEVCRTNSDCSPGLACLLDGFSTPRCTVLRSSPTFVAASSPTPTSPGGAPFADVADDGCQLTSQPRAQGLSGRLLIVGLAAVAMLYGRRRSNRPRL